MLKKFFLDRLFDTSHPKSNRKTPDVGAYNASQACVASTPGSSPCRLNTIRWKCLCRESSTKTTQVIASCFLLLESRCTSRCTSTDCLTNPSETHASPFAPSPSPSHFLLAHQRSRHRCVEIHRKKRPVSETLARTRELFHFHS